MNNDCHICYSNDFPFVRLRIGLVQTYSILAYLNVSMFSTGYGVMDQVEDQLQTQQG